MTARIKIGFVLCDNQDGSWTMYDPDTPLEQIVSGKATMLTEGMWPMDQADFQHALSQWIHLDQARRFLEEQKRKDQENS